VSGDIWAPSPRTHRLLCAEASGVWQVALAGLPMPVVRRVWALGVLRGWRRSTPDHVFEAAGVCPSGSIRQFVDLGSSDLARCPS